LILKSKKIKMLITALFVIYMILFFASGASAAIVSKINYGEETVKLTGGAEGGVVIYMYCPNVNPELAVKLDSKGNIINEPDEKKKLAAEKWYPVYGDTIDLSTFIPQTDEIKLAFRNANEFPDADGVYKSRVLSDYIPCRPAITDKTSIKKSIEYCPQTETIDIKDDALAGGYEYKIGISGWQKGNGSSINVSSKYNALGGTVIIRKSASEINKTFASTEYKIKIPIAPPVPKLKIKDGKIIGIDLNQVYSTSPDGIDDYKPFKSKTIDISDIDNQLGIDTSGKDYIDIYIKTPATDKKPSSPIQKLHIDLTGNKK